MKFLILSCICLFFQSCDPTYVIAIQNDSNETIKFKGQINERFRTFNYDSIPIAYLDNNWIEAEIKPEQQLDCGFAIADLENDMPFNSIKIFVKNDTLIANNNDELLELFDNRSAFNVMRPYILVVD